MASSTSAQFRITPPPPTGYSGKLNFLASVSSKAFFFGHKTTAFYPKLRAKSVVLRVVNEKVDGFDLETNNSARGAELLRALNMKMGPHGEEIPPLVWRNWNYGFCICFAFFGNGFVKFFVFCFLFFCFFILEIVICDIESWNCVESGRKLEMGFSVGFWFCVLGNGFVKVFTFWKLWHWNGV